MNPQDPHTYFNYLKQFQQQPPPPNANGQYYFPFPFHLSVPPGYGNPYPFRFPYFPNPYGTPEQMVQRTPQQQQQSNVIIISDDEEAPKRIIEKTQTIPIPVPAPPQQRKPTKMLDLDQLESQGRLYDCESSESPQLPRRTIRQIRYEQYQSPKLKKRQIKIRKETSRVPAKSVKQVPIGVERQQLTFPQSSVKTRLIRVYVKNEEKFQRLYDTLKLSCPNCNDEDVARILNIAGKDYDRAMSLIQENGLSIQYFIETYQNKDQSDEEATDKK